MRQENALVLRRDVLSRNSNDFGLSTLCPLQFSGQRRFDGILQLWNALSSHEHRLGDVSGESHVAGAKLIAVESEKRHA